VAVRESLLGDGRSVTLLSFTQTESDGFPAEHYETSYKHFIKSLKYLPSFAPAFTSLGMYYADAAQPPDPNRASKCFQKAFELDAREGDAARRLAEGFSEEREWDLVEVVAKRTIEGEGGAKDGASESESITASRYLPTNAWAWKAMGVVHLVRDDLVAPGFGR
jgi:superkiller protein 3